MAVDMFLKIGNNDIKGESIDGKHKDEIDILSWSWGAKQQGTSHVGTGAGAGKVAVSDLSITRHLDKASPLLFLACCSGRHFDKVYLTCRKAGGESQVEYLKITLTGVFVSSVQSGGSEADDRPTETVTLNFAQWKTEYTPQDAKGAATGVVAAAWDIAKAAKA